MERTTHSSQGRAVPSTVLAPPTASRVIESTPYLATDGGALDKQRSTRQMQGRRFCSGLFSRPSALLRGFAVLTPERRDAYALFFEQRGDYPIARDQLPSV